MASSVPRCRAITIFAFRGDRFRTFASAFLKLLSDERIGAGTGPAVLDCLLFAGHTGVSTNGGTTIYGLNPDGSGVPVWQMMDRLKSGEGFPGVVRDDTAVFQAAQSRGLSVLSFDVILPDPQFQNFQIALDSELGKSQNSYGFPNGDGDCNCTTWLERLGLPLLTGRMDEFVALRGIVLFPSRRFGKCV